MHAFQFSACHATASGPSTHFTIGLRVPSTTVEEFSTEDDIDIAHEQQDILVILPSTLVLVPHLFGTDAKSFGC